MSFLSSHLRLASMLPAAAAAVVPFLAGWGALGLVSCAHPQGMVDAVAVAPPGQGFSRPALVGVWEVVGCESLVPRGEGSPASIPNSKYCFNSTAAYPDLAPDSVGDSADGGGEWSLSGSETMVIRTGVPGGVHSFQLISISSDQLVWHVDGRHVTLRRVARDWDGSHAPKLLPKEIAISYPR